MSGAGSTGARATRALGRLAARASERVRSTAAIGAVVAALVGGLPSVAAAQTSAEAGQVGSSQLMTTEEACAERQRGAVAEVAARLAANGVTLTLGQFETSVLNPDDEDAQLRARANVRLLDPRGGAVRDSPSRRGQCDTPYARVVLSGDAQLSVPIATPFAFGGAAVNVQGRRAVDVTSTPEAILTQPLPAMSAEELAADAPVGTEMFFLATRQVGASFSLGYESDIPFVRVDARGASVDVDLARLRGVRVVVHPNGRLFVSVHRVDSAALEILAFRLRAGAVPSDGFDLPVVSGLSDTLTRLASRFRVEALFRAMLSRTQEEAFALSPADVGQLEGGSAAMAELLGGDAAPLRALFQSGQTGSSVARATLEETRRQSEVQLRAEIGRLVRLLRLERGRDVREGELTSFAPDGSVEPVRYTLVRLFSELGGLIPDWLGLERDAEMRLLMYSDGSGDRAALSIDAQREDATLTPRELDGLKAQLELLGLDPEVVQQAIESARDGDVDVALGVVLQDEAIRDLVSRPPEEVRNAILSAHAIINGADVRELLAAASPNDRGLLLRLLERPSWSLTAEPKTPPPAASYRELVEKTLGAEGAYSHPRDALVWGLAQQAAELVTLAKTDATTAEIGRRFAKLCTGGLNGAAANQVLIGALGVLNIAGLIVDEARVGDVGIDEGAPALRAPTTEELLMGG